ncbi:hypothetical protein F2P81_007700 [Scophthalmus maximus]|uniref:Uncharacterized protein n=1 Tax=Scophthalmus maximus TaxID=52904 RepID=A0A6A4T2Y4_SCOMX|nr:hypothetical protein F2P81_007700 [Scophthalmus maximus]
MACGRWNCRMPVNGKICESNLNLDIHNKGAEVSRLSGISVVQRFVKRKWFKFNGSLHGWFRRCRENRINTRTGNEDPDKQFYTEQLFVFEYHFHLNKSKYVSDRVG